MEISIFTTGILRESTVYTYKIASLYYTAKLRLQARKNRT